MHRTPPPLSERLTRFEVFETIIKAIDLFVPYERRGKPGLFGGARVGLTVLLTEKQLLLRLSLSNEARNLFVEAGEFLLENAIQTRKFLQKDLLSIYGVLCISLAFSIFAWGTGYKLSLYNPGHEHSPAKVCTRGSEAAKDAVEHAARNKALTHAPLSIAVLFSLHQETENCPFDRRGDDAGGDLSPLSRAPILYLRPPPYGRRILG